MTTSAIFREAEAHTLERLSADYFGGVEAYGLDRRLKRWVRETDLLACAGLAGRVYTMLDYFHAWVTPPRDFSGLPGLQRRSFESFFWQRAQDNLQANFGALLRALAITALLPDEWFPQAALDRQIRARLKSMRIFLDVEIKPDLGLSPGGLGWLAAETRDAVEALREPLSAGNPQILHLLQNPANLCGNSQVIAYGLEAGEGVLEVKIYDPGYHCEAHKLKVDLAGERPVITEECRDHPGRSLAGLLLCDYQPAAPNPNALSRFQRNPPMKELSWRLLYHRQKLHEWLKMRWGGNKLG